MTQVFVDTSYVIALLNRSDPHHAAAVDWREKLQSEPWEQITTTAVLLELGDGFAAKGRWDLLSPVLRAMCDDQRVSVVSVDVPLIHRARELRDSRVDKDWGLTDCVSFVVMESQGMRDALTADRHFEQAGYRRLLVTTT